MDNIQTNNRKIYLDVLRILAIFLVLFTHTGTNGNKLYMVVSGEIQQKVYIMLDCLRTINNPLLFMISGALLLGKDENIDIIWKKRIMRFFICLLLFSYIQVIWNLYFSENQIRFNAWETFKSLLSNPLRPQYWFLYSYICFLAMLPFQRSIAQQLNDTQFKYLLILSIVTMDLFPLIALKLGIQRINFSIFLNSFTTLYPLLGYYLDKNGDRLMKKWMYPIMMIVGILGVLFATHMTVWNYIEVGEWEERFITLFYTFTAVIVFLLIKKLMSWLERNNLIKSKVAGFIQFISSTTFGIYLLENILEKFTWPLFNTLRRFIPCIFACWIWIIVTMIFGAIVVKCMRKVPGLKKLL